MQDATVGSQQAPAAGYSLQEAATLLGIGVNTLRRHITAGQVRAERVQRPQGYVWRVYLDGRHPANDLAGDPLIQEATGRLPQPPAQLAQAEVLASLIQATLTPIVAPLVAEQAALRQTVERQAEQLVGQAERVGALIEQVGHRERELDRSSAEIATLNETMRAAEFSRRRERRLVLLAVAVLGALLVLVLVLVLVTPVWVR